jgi:ER degradation enhancer, mannosidase alpha-like 1
MLDEGDIQNAIKFHLTFWNIWKKHGGLPEVYDQNYLVATSLQYPLRPEFIESTWYLYRVSTVEAKANQYSDFMKATNDPFYLDVGNRVLQDIIARAKVDCGLTGIQGAPFPSSHCDGALISR